MGTKSLYKHESSILHKFAHEIFWLGLPWFQILGMQQMGVGAMQIWGHFGPVACK